MLKETDVSRRGLQVHRLRSVESSGVPIEGAREGKNE